MILLFLNDLLSGIVFLLYLYQTVYLLVCLLKKPVLFPKAEAADIAVLICAKNEEAVIGDLLKNLATQTHPKEKLHVFVCADHCTDRTVELSRELGAVVYERTGEGGVGKPYAMDFLLRNIRRDYPGGFDGFLVLDADNLLKNDFVEKMNDALMAGNEIITSYRNSKNFGDTWISAGSALWFLRECRNLQQARTSLGVSCTSSGTGYLFSRNVAKELGGWPYRTLTEDIEFTMNQVLAGRKIVYCAEAELFDEQPTDFQRSWEQRLRWTKGFLQCLALFWKPLLKKAVRGDFSSYDMLMILAPMNLLTLICLPVNLLICIACFAVGAPIAPLFLYSTLRFIGGLYATTFINAVIFTFTERKHIRAGTWKKILYTFTTPVHVFCYIPLSFAAVTSKVTWIPTRHNISARELQSRPCEERLPL